MSGMLSRRSAVALMLAYSVGATLLSTLTGCGHRAAAEKAPTDDFSLKSNAFANEGPLPFQHTADGVNSWPSLQWSGIPSGTREFALICDEPDAPGGRFVHWVMYKIPPDTQYLQEAPRRIVGARIGSPSGDMFQGRNSRSTENRGYFGPDPARGSGVHRYRFRLFALGRTIHLSRNAWENGTGATAEEVEAEIENITLGVATLFATYERK